jgi:hypothetical protein
MKASLSLFLTGVLMMGAASLAFGDDTRDSENSAKHASSSHHSRSSTHHRSTGSQHHSSSGTNSGSKTHSNIPSN